MPTNAENAERITRLEEQFAGYKVLLDERDADRDTEITTLRRQVIGLALVVVGLVAWAIGNGFDIGGIPGAPV